MILTDVVARATRRATLLGGLREIVSIAFHLLRYPLGMRDGGDPRPRQQVPEVPIRRTDRAPVLLVHGYAHNRSGWFLLERRLHRAEFSHVFALNYNPLTSDIPTLAAALGHRVEAICEVTGSDKLHLVGHSLGGILIRYYIQVLGGSQRADTAVTIASPHEGTRMARLALGPTGVQLRPDSPVMRVLDETAVPSDVRWIAFYSDLDLFLQPGASARLEHPSLAATNVLIADHGHLGLLSSPELSRSVVERLTERVDPAGRGDARAGASPACGPDATVPLRAPFPVQPEATTLVGAH